MGNSKIIYGDKVLMDLSGDTVAADTLLRGATAHGNDGELIVGSCSYDVDSSNATVEVAEMLLGKTAYARGQKLVGTMLNNSGVAGQISTKTGKYTVPIGYHDGSGVVQIALEEQAKLIPANIRQGVEVLVCAAQWMVRRASRPRPKPSRPSPPRNPSTRMQGITICPA